MTTFPFYPLSALFAGVGTGYVFKQYYVIAGVLFLIAILFTVPNRVWVSIWTVIKAGFGYTAPRAQALGVQVANRAGHVADQASAGFQAKPYFWSAVISGTALILATFASALVLGSYWYENWVVWLVLGGLLAISAVCFINYYDRWSNISNGLAKAGEFLGECALEFLGWATTKFLKYPLYVITTILVALAISSHYFDQLAGDKLLLGILAFLFIWASVVTARDKWDEFWEITFGGLRPILISLGVILLFIGIFTNAFVHVGLGELIAYFGVISILVGTIGIALWNKVP